jgi:hypothetical protein
MRQGLCQRFVVAGIVGSAVVTIFGCRLASCIMHSKHRLSVPVCKHEQVVAGFAGPVWHAVYAWVHSPPGATEGLLTACDDNRMQSGGQGCVWLLLQLVALCTRGGVACGHVGVWAPVCAGEI